jgi:hypothetical protein
VCILAITTIKRYQRTQIRSELQVAVSPASFDGSEGKDYGIAGPILGGVFQKTVQVGAVGRVSGGREEGLVWQTTAVKNDPGSTSKPGDVLEKQSPRSVSDADRGRE